MRSWWCLAVALGLGVGGTAVSADLFVAPDSAADGDGSAARPLALARALAADGPARPGDRILLRAGVYRGNRVPDSIKITPWVVGVSGTAEQPVVIQPAPGQPVYSVLCDGVFELRGSYIHLIGLEIGNPVWDPAVDVRSHQDGSTLVNAMAGTGAKVLNCNVFGGGMAMGLWQSTTDLEVSGCLIHDFGYRNAQGHLVHSLYTQNTSGTKTFRRNLAWRSSGFHLHAYGSAGRIEGYDVRENIFFLAGTVQTKAQTYDNYLVMAKLPCDRITLIGNVGYTPSQATPWRANLRLGSYGKEQNGTAVVRDNYLAGAPNGLCLGNFRDAEISGNTVWAGTVLAEISAAVTGAGWEGEARPDLKHYRVDNNTYYANVQARPFRHGAGKKDEDALLDFAAWQALGLDAHGRFLPGKDGKPTGTRVFVFPNALTPGRAHVGVFNWDGLATAAVDLAPALAKGQHAVAYNVLDVTGRLSAAKPVLSFTYDGAPVSLPLRRDPASPDFDAFLILPVE